MKYALINCYSDYNKGDLGIILSTVKFIRENDADANIVGVSTYNYSDPQFFTDHTLLKKELPVYSSIFGELNIGKNKSSIAKLVRFVFDSIRLLLFMVFPSKRLLSDKERETYEVLKEADYIISKGGSFICDENDIRVKISLLRLLYIFILSIRACKKSKLIVLCQSLGPVYGKLGRVLVNYVLKHCHYIVLREDTCIQQYPYLKVPADKKIVFNDIAFFLDSDWDNRIDKKLLFSGEFKVGITIKTVSLDKQQEYREMMKRAIEYLASKYNAAIYIFPHVTVDDDLQASFEVYKLIDDKQKENIHILTNNYSSRELKSFYGMMDFMISTRLHSAIFAIGEGVPAINIAYHGTKSQGIYANMHLSNLMIDSYSSEKLICLIDDVVLNKTSYKRTISERMGYYESEQIVLYKKVFLE